MDTLTLIRSAVRGLLAAADPDLAAGSVTGNDHLGCSIGPQPAHRFQVLIVAISGDPCGRFAANAACESGR